MGKITIRLPSLRRLSKSPCCRAVRTTRDRISRDGSSQANFYQPLGKSKKQVTKRQLKHIQEGYCFLRDIQQNKDSPPNPKHTQNTFRNVFCQTTTYFGYLVTFRLCMIQCYCLYLEKLLPDSIFFPPPNLFAV